MSGTRKLFLFVALPLLIVFAIVAYLAFGKNDQNSDKTTESKPSSTASIECPALVTPVVATDVVAILYPGQVRGGDFKPHGGFGMNNTEDNLVDVKAPLDARITSGSRYIEQDELQYMFEFENDCGLKYRFDHLRTLSAKLQAVADKFPEAKVDDSRTTEIKGNVTVVAGDIVASAVGFEKSPDDINRRNVGFDFGLYDTRQKNESAQDSVWVAAHQEDGDQAIYAVCWLDWLPATDAVMLKALPGGDGLMGKTSDYCK